MTTRTITIQVTQDKDVEVCDHCGMGDDRAPLITFEPDRKSTEYASAYEPVHFHRGCLETMGATVPPGTTYGELVEEMNSIAETAVFAADRFDACAIAIGIVLIYASRFVGDMRMQVFVFCVGGFVLSTGATIAYRQARRTVEDR